MNSETNSEHSLRILVIDDLFAARRVITRVLKKLGYTNIVEAETGKDGFEALISNKEINFVITDLNLGDMKALELLEMLKSNEEYVPKPVLVISSDADREDVEKAVDLGASGFLLKPFNMDSLGSKMDEILDSLK